MTVKLSQGSTSCFLSLKVAFKFIQPHKPHRLWLKAPYVSCFFFFFFTHGWDQWFAARNVCLTKWITPSSLNSPVILACTFTFRKCLSSDPRRGERAVRSLHQTLDSHCQLHNITITTLSPRTHRPFSSTSQRKEFAGCRACCSRRGQGLLLEWINL